MYPDGPTLDEFQRKNKWTDEELLKVDGFTKTLESGEVANFSLRSLAMLCEMRGMIAILQLMVGKYMKAAYNLRKTW